LFEKIVIPTAHKYTTFQLIFVYT